MFLDLNDVNKRGSSCAPSVLIYFINMMLMGESEPNKGCDTYMYEGQKTFQQFLVLGTVICIPTLLLGKPLHMMMTRKKHQRLEPENVSNWCR